MPVAKGQKGVRQELHKFKAGTLHSGSKTGPLVTKRSQMLAIYMHEKGNEQATGHADRRKPTRKKS